MVLQRFSGTLCVNELHLGVYTLLLATDPLADLPVSFALVGANDKDHMRRFLRNLARWGLRPEVVVSDGSNLYPQLVAEIWPQSRHQLCIFHLLHDLLDKVLGAVRRLRRVQASRGRAGRKQRDYRKLLVAPVTMRQRFMEMIEREREFAAVGRPARIIAKMNQLEDWAMCEALLRASVASPRPLFFRPVARLAAD
jgi:hypothetical protein